MVATGVEVVLTHGNGPQVGNLLVKNELAAHVVPPVPLDWCVAQTQATIGFTLADELDAALAARGLPQRTAGLVTRTLVDVDDPGFREPSQAGRPLPPARGGGTVRLPRPDLGGPRRARLAPGGRLPRAEVRRRLPRDPRPGRGRLRRRLRRRRRHPGDRRRPGRRRALRGVEAVIDKDLTAAILARELDADTLVIATDVPNVMVDFGTPSARPLGRVTVAELREHAAAGQFARGSMGPKVEAALRFVERRRNAAPSSRPWNTSPTPSEATTPAPS